MTATLRLTVVTGPHRGARFCMRGLSACMLGRSSQCQVRLCGTERDQHISRNHCQFLFAPPLVRVQDMDSANGTYINGHKVGEGDDVRDCFEKVAHLGVARDGDVITVGGTSLMIQVTDCTEEFPAPSYEEPVVMQDCPMC